MKIVLRILPLGCIVLAISAISPPSSMGDRTGSEGVMWLSMSLELRNNYAGAYVQGFNSGFDFGCANGTHDARPSGSGFENDPVHICNSKAPSFGNTTKLTESVTEFFQKYPDNRFLYIKDVINALGRGMSFEEIHKHATPIGITSPQ
jgi:hypothetical protein